MKNCMIIGAGILGASTAYHLAKAGVTVTIVDRAAPGRATDAAAGIVCPWLTQRRNKAWYTLAKNGARYYPALIEELKREGEDKTGYAKVGALRLHSDDEKLEQLEKRAMQRREDAPEIGEITRLTAREAQAMFPPLAEGYGAVFISGAARVSGSSLRDALIRAATKHGANFIAGEAKLLIDGDRAIGIKLDGQTLLADTVIVTAGVWAPGIFQPHGLNFSVKPQKAQIVHLQLPQAETQGWPVIMPPNNQYILSFDEGRIVAGATHEDNVGFDVRVTPAGLHEVLDKALAIAPGLANSTVLETRVGFRPFTPGYLPIIGAVPEYKGLLVANGLGASGLTVGPFLGAELAKLALQEITELDLSHYQVTDAFSSFKKEGT